MSTNSCLNPVPAISRTILLVEDEPFVRESTSRILQLSGFQVIGAVDADEATKVFQNRHVIIDLVMTDMVLPGRSGLQLIEELRKVSPDLPALLTSGYPQKSLNDSKASACYYLCKPYSRHSLLEKITEILGSAAGARVATANG